jgi:hypothetical protein
MDKLLSTFAFNFNLRRYDVVAGIGGCGATGDGDVMMRFLPCYQAVWLWLHTYIGQPKWISGSEQHFGCIRGRVHP